MKTAVVYYSRTHTTEDIAKDIDLELDADVLQVKSSLYPLGFTGYVRAIFHALNESMQPIETDHWDLTQYDLVIVGSPVWGAHMSSPIRSFLMQYASQIKDVAYYVTCGGSGADAAIAKMIELGQKRPVATMKITSADITDETFERKISAFTEEIRRAKIHTLGHHTNLPA